METNTETKAYKIDLSRIEEGYMYDQFIAYAENKNKAKSKLLHEVRHEGLETKGEEVNYLNIPVVRSKKHDLILFEEEYISVRKRDSILADRERINKLNSILDDASTTHCYIMKRGQYYRPNSCGYTDFKLFAGVYSKEEAVSDGKSCSDLFIVPINNEEHNNYILDKINELKGRIIS